MRMLKLQASSFKLKLGAWLLGNRFFAPKPLKSPSSELGASSLELELELELELARVSWSVDPTLSVAERGRAWSVERGSTLERGFQARRKRQPSAALTLLSVKRKARSVERGHCLPVPLGRPTVLPPALGLKPPE